MGIKRRVLLSLSREQVENGKKKMLENIQQLNNNIDLRCAQGEEVSPRDNTVLTVTKMRSMLSMMSN